MFAAPAKKGLTETCVAATWTSAHDVWHGSSGSLLPGFQLRLVGPDGADVRAHDEAGEILFRASNLFVGYLGNAKATKETIGADGWHRTGDMGVMRVGPNGYEHLFIRDRIKDMIKVKVRLPSCSYLLVVKCMYANWVTVAGNSSPPRRD